MKQTQTYLIFGLLLIIVGGGSFFAGTKYQQSKVPNFNNFRGQFGDRGAGGLRQGTGANRMMGGRQIIGEITAADGDSITVKLADGSSKIILLSTTASVVKTTESTASDLKIGDKVGIFGTENTDGSVSAQNIQLNPIIRNIPSPIPTK